jgi:hypothetical protein
MGFIPTSVFLKIFLFVAELSIGKCRKSGNPHQEDLAKLGYKPNMKYKTLIIVLYFWLHTQNLIQKLKSNIII